MQILDFMWVIILLLVFLWETAHSLDFYCAIVFKLTYRFFEPEGILRSVNFCCCTRCWIFDGMNQFFFVIYVQAKTGEDLDESLIIPAHQGIKELV